MNAYLTFNSKQMPYLLLYCLNTADKKKKLSEIKRYHYEKEISNCAL